MVHAGILPQWSVDKAESLAREAGAELQGKKIQEIFWQNVRQQADCMD